MKIARLVDPRLHTALNKLVAGDLPLRTAFKLKGIKKIVNEEYSKYEEVRNSALEKYGKKNAEGHLDLNDKKEVQFEGTAMQDFAKELAELVNLEIELPTINLAELGDKINITLEDAEMLEGLLVE